MALKEAFGATEKTTCISLIWELNLFIHKCSYANYSYVKSVILKTTII